MRVFAFQSMKQIKRVVFVVFTLILSITTVVVFKTTLGTFAKCFEILLSDLFTKHDA